MLNIGVWGPVAVTFIYVVIGVDQALKAAWPQAWLWFSYASANVGIIWFNK